MRHRPSHAEPAAGWATGPALAAGATATAAITTPAAAIPFSMHASSYVPHVVPLPPPVSARSSSPGGVAAGASAGELPRSVPASDPPASCVFRCDSAVLGRFAGELPLPGACEVRPAPSRCRLGPRGVARGRPGTAPPVAGLIPGPARRVWDPHPQP